MPETSACSPAPRAQGRGAGGRPAGPYHPPPRPAPRLAPRPPGLVGREPGLSAPLSRILTSWPPPGASRPYPSPYRPGREPPKACECRPTCPDGATAFRSQSLSSPRCPRRAPPALNPRRPRPRLPRPGLGVAGGTRGCPRAGAPLGRDPGLESRAGLADAPRALPPAAA